MLSTARIVICFDFEGISGFDNEQEKMPIGMREGWRPLLRTAKGLQGQLIQRWTTK